MNNIFMADSISDEKLTEAFPPSNITFENKVKILHNLRARIICEDNSLQGLLTFVPSSVVPDNHSMFAQVAYTNGDEMFFGDRFFSMDVPVQLAIILHEMFHIVFRHCSRGKKRIGSLYNIAADAIINSSIGFKDEGSIESNSYCYLIKKDVVNLDSLYEEFNIPSCEQKHFSQWTTEDLYEYLIKKLKDKLEQQVKNQEKNKNKKSKKKNKSSSTNSSTKGQGNNPSDNPGSGELPGKGESGQRSSSKESELEKLEKEIEELANKLAKKHKTISGSDIKEGGEKIDPTNAQIDDFIWTQRFNRAKAQSNKSRNSILGKVNADVYKAQILWYVELRKYLVKRCMPLTEISYNRPSRRMASLKQNKIFLPGLQNQKGLDKMVVIIDTSGSCFNEEELTMFCTEIQSIQEQTNVEIALIFADTDVRSETIVKADGNSLLEKIKKGWIKPKGGGGTDMVTPFLYTQKKYNPKLTVIASDGLTPFPTQKQIGASNLIWVINTNVEVPKGSGKALYINPKSI